MSFDLSKLIVRPIVHEDREAILAIDRAVSGIERKSYIEAKTFWATELKGQLFSSFVAEYEGTVIGFMAFLPIIGASVVFIPATVILLVQGKTGVALGYLAYNVCYSSITEYVIKPRLIGKGMSMNPILVFIGILGGLKLFGILGIVYGPLIMTIFLTLAEIYRLEYKDSMA